MTEWYKKSVEDTFNELSTSEDGLSKSKVEELLQEYGPNEIREVDGHKWYKILFEQFTEIMVIILIVAAVISFAVGELVDAIAILVIVVINAVIGFIQEYKAEKAIDELRKLAAPDAVVIRDGETKHISAKELVPGDIVILEEGTFIPADARLFEEAELETDEASLTGESRSVAKQLEPISEDKGIGDRLNMVFMGTTVVHGHGKAVVVNTGMDTEFGSIAHMVQTEKSDKTPLQQQLAKLSKVLAAVILVIIAILFVSSLIAGRDPVEMLILSISLAVSVIPEGLPAVITLTLAIAVQKMVKKNAIIRKLPAAETLGSTSIICTDKTGTLTQNQMTVKKIYIAGALYDVSGTGYKPEGKFTKDEEEVDPTEIEVFDQLLRAGALCNNARLMQSDGTWEIIGDPTEGCLLTVAKKAGINPEELDKSHQRLHELVFDSERKRMSVVASFDDSPIMYTKGAVDSLLDICTHIKIDGEIKELSESKKEELMKKNDELAEQAYRVLGFAYKETDSKSKPEEKDMIYLGMTAMIDPPRPEVAEAISKCIDAHVKVVMITGDHALTAKAIGEEIGLYNEGDEILTGTELENTSDEELEDLVEKVRIYARVNPKHKVKILKALKKKDYIVAMTGDGVNDAPALKSADIGVAMGITGTDVSKEASQMILTDDNFATIVNSVESGRVVYRNIKKFIRYLLSANFDEVLVISIVFFMGLPIPFIPIQILWINILTDALPALALGVDVPDKDVMKLKPRNPKGSIFKELVLFSMVAGLIATAVSLTIYFRSINIHEIEYTRTLMITTIVVFELFLAFSVRHDKAHYFTNFFKNKYLLLSIVGSLILHMLTVYAPPLQKVLETRPIMPIDWAWIVGLSAVAIMIIEIWKKFRKPADHV